LLGEIEDLNFQKNMNKLINNLIKKGKKALANRIVFKMIADIKNNSIGIQSFINNSISNCQPKIVLKTKKISGIKYRIPTPYLLNNNNLGCKFILKNCKSPISKTLKNEIMNSFEKRGLAIKKRNELHKIGIQNRSNIKL
jgi:small subunit ribosomal protein S7